MTSWIYKYEQKVSIIEKISKLYLILHTKLHILISLLWSKIDEYYNNKILKKLVWILSNFYMTISIYKRE